ncbi:helix-turn-helix transcriptional regulator [Grimontia sp. NTOU-MAR1]|uniref:helix-turn-helix transcriptional regulator n=1 Tax=Grimontia sp. NTOU-MAR1 TaxID=3111011 RepID=UPI002DB6E853|nr:helix-turn-helix transcriptional regulator [Grimontia sp. NTOU-MAR1]WRV98733.1 helix-turn-helix transcriptional regulator [Grimontia sp. NTOU-MAR1]
MSKAMSNVTMAQRVKIARAESGKTQVEMARLLCIARQTYLDLETGKTEPRVSTLKDIAAITNFPLLWFFDEVEEDLDHQRTQHSQDVVDFLKVVSRLPDNSRKEFLQTSKQLATCMVNLVEGE